MPHFAGQQGSVQRRDGCFGARGDDLARQAAAQADHGRSELAGDVTQLVPRGGEVIDLLVGAPGGYQSPGRTTARGDRHGEKLLRGRGADLAGAWRCPAPNAQQAPDGADRDTGQFGDPLDPDALLA
ncbi:hypothetical protein ACVBEQ_27545 [Nakamurella sp. GG22]